MTNQRLMFLSSGGNDAIRRATGAAVSGPAGGLLAAGKTDSLDLSALASEGSLSIPLNDLQHYEFIKKMFRNYLSIGFTNSDGNSEAYAFMNQHGLPGGREWQDAIAGAKGNRRADGVSVGRLKRPHLFTGDLT
ncbi:MAG: hypothetical protein M3343_06585 [Actinomycetota bacterium]|nr:hypothetical protein [Actinomycetota bacterium]